MKFDQPHQIEGEFWLPQTDRRFYGRIDHTDEATRMHLVNSSVIPTYGGQPIAPTLTLFGDTDAGLVSVLDLHPITWTTRGDHANSIECLVETVLFGAHVNAFAELEALSVAVGVHGLEETLAGAWPEPGLLSPQGGPHGNGEVLAVDLADGVEIIFQVGEHRNIVNGQLRPAVYADARIVLPQSLTFRLIEEDLIFPIRDLVQFCTRRVSYVNSLTIFRDPELLHAIRILKAPYPRPDDRSRRKVDALSLNLGRVGDPAAVVSRWLGLSREVGPVWPIFFAALRGAGLLDDRFLGLVAFVEGFHRALHDDPPLSRADDKLGKRLVSDALAEHPTIRGVFKEALGHANSQSLRDRVAFFAANAAEALNWKLDVDLFSAEIVHTRNWMVHWGSPGRHVVRETAGLVRLVRSLEVVLAVAVMTDAGLDSAAIRSAITSGWKFEGLP